MEKQILIELERMRSLMNLINEQGSADIYIDRISQQQRETAPDTFGPMDQYTSIKIGEGTNYPVILDGYTTQVMGNPNPILKQSGSGTKASDFIPDVKVDEKGNEYIERNGKKYCLPDKKFWDILNSKNYVYQIVNPRNNEKFRMRLRNNKPVDVPIVDENGKITQQKLSGPEASIRCVGGDNGWGFDIYGGEVIFWSKEGESYNTTNPEHFDLRSDFDVWWDKWGVAVEIGIGLLASFTGAGLAGYLIRLGFLAESGLTGAYALKSSETWLSVILQAGFEAGLMFPIANYQWKRGQESNAILSIAFSFLPFLTELGSVQKYIRGGIQPGVSRSLESKVSSFGGADALSNKETYGNFLDSLSASELMLWKATVDQFSTKENQKMFADAVSKYLKENESRITSEILGNKESVDKMDDLTAGQFSKGAKLLLKTNPLKGTNALAGFIRMSIPIAGVAISFTSVYNKLKSYGYDDGKIEKFKLSLENSLKNSEFFMKIINLNKELYKTLMNKVLIDLVSDKKNADEISGGNKTSEQIKNMVETRAVEMIESDPKTYQSFASIINTTDKINDSFKSELIIYLEENGHQNVTITDETPFKTYKFSSDKTPNGLITIKTPTNFTRSKDTRNYDYKSGIEIST